MTVGLPITVPTVGGIAEIVEDGVNGYKIEVQKLEQIGDYIRNILFEKELIQSWHRHWCIQRGEHNTPNPNDFG